MIIVTGSVTARADTFDAVREVSLDHVRRSRTEDGCISHSVQVDCENPLRLFFFEQWRDMATLTAHFHVAGSVEFLGTVRKLAASSEAVTLYDVTALPTPQG